MVETKQKKGARFWQHPELKGSGPPPQQQLYRQMIMVGKKARFWQHPKLKGSGPPHQQQLYRQMTMVKEKRYPVSYTHLTLPTICSV